MYCYAFRVTTDGVQIGNRIYWTLTERTYDGLTDLHTPKITVPAAHTKSSKFSLAVAR
jgi:hypothetical protein